MTIIDGKYHAESILDKLRLDIDELASKNVKPRLAIILVGDHPASKIYVTAKMAKAEEFGIKADLFSFSDDISTESLLENIDRINRDDNIHAIIVQLPLPSHINKFQVQNKIAPEKDVDGFHPINVGLLHNGSNNGFIPCTPLGCLYLIKSCAQDMRGMNAVVIGRSDIVGKPMAALLLRENATVTICHSHTKNLSLITRSADIVVAAMGSGHFLKKEYFKEDAIVIDVGITRLNSSSKLVGDVDFESVQDHVAYITPVPKGVGPMTIAYLLYNTVKATKNITTLVCQKKL